jgi:hypothetical protein
VKRSISQAAAFCLALLALALFIAPASAQLVQITSVGNFNFGTWSGSGNLHSSDDVCIYKSSGGTTYVVTASGSGGGGAFTIAKAGGTLAYEVRWKQSGGVLSQLTANVGAGFSGASNSFTCNGTPNATVDITFTLAALSAAKAGTYTGTLTILISPS